MALGGLGRRPPETWEHVQRMPMRAIMPAQSFVLEKGMIVPSWSPLHNQGKQGACVGHGTSAMLAMLHEHWVRRKGDKNPYVRYNPWWLWDRAKEIDPWPDTNPGDDNGTTVKAACQVLIEKGHVLWPDETNPASISDPAESYGVAAVRWATTVDQIRTSLFNDIPVSVGFNWYASFDNPEYIDTEYYVGRDLAKLGLVEGGHCFCIFRGSDRRQACQFWNSWGPDYPMTWMTYECVDRLLREDGEAALVTDQ